MLEISRHDGWPKHRVTFSFTCAFRAASKSFLKRNLPKRINKAVIIDEQNVVQFGGKINF